MKTPLMPKHTPKSEMLCGSSYGENVKQYGPAPNGWRWREVGEAWKAGDLFVLPFRFVSLCANSTALEHYWPVITPVETSAALEYKVVYEDETFVLIKITGCNKRENYVSANTTVDIAFGSAVSSWCPSCTLYVGRGNGMNKTVCIEAEWWPRVKETISEYNLKHSAPVKPKKPKTVTFNYSGGTYNGFRTVKVEEETPEIIKGIDLADNRFKSYRKDKIVGKILTVKA